MTLKNRHGWAYFECDECGDETEEFDDELPVVTQQIKALGWTITKNDETKKWEHFCPACGVR